MDLDHRACAACGRPVGDTAVTRASTYPGLYDGVVADNRLLCKNCVSGRYGGGRAKRRQR